MPIPERVTNHLEAAKARFISQFKSPKPVLHGMLQSYVDQLQELEDVIWDVIDYRLLDAAPGRSHGAEGVQLDVLGRIVGQPRMGLTDAAYRTAIRLRIRVNRSRGSAADLLEILRLAMPNPKVFTYDELYHLASYIYVEDISVDLAITLITSLDAARAAGYRAILEYHTDRVASGDMLRWGWDHTGGVGGAGSESDATAGGLLYIMQG